MTDKLIIYHNGVCSKSNGALEVLLAHNIPHEVRWYMQEPLNKQELQQLLTQLHMQPSQIIRTNESIYTELFADNTLSEEQCLDALASYPILMQRPIVAWKDKAIIARPGNLVLDFIKTV